jgi:TonB family protein
MILTSLVLLPVMAHAQARAAAEPQPSTSSAMLVAELTQPVMPVELAIATAPSVTATTPSGAAAAISAVNLPANAAIKVFVRTQMTENFADAALRQGGTLEYSMFGSLPTHSSAPAVVRAVEVSLSKQEMDDQPAVSNVVVHATVDEYGFPRNVTVVHSAGSSVVDRKVLAAVNQYRFKPATQDNKPVPAAVTISIQIAKP